MPGQHYGRMVFRELPVLAANVPFVHRLPVVDRAYYSTDNGFSLKGKQNDPFPLLLDCPEEIKEKTQRGFLFLYFPLIQIGKDCIEIPHLGF